MAIVVLMNSGAGSYEQTTLLCQGHSTTRHACIVHNDHTFTGSVELELDLAFDFKQASISRAVASINRQQMTLSHTQSSAFKRPIEELTRARTLVLSEISSTRVVSEMARHDWIDESPAVYFELVGDVAKLFEGVLFIANRQHTNGLEVISMFYEGSLVVVVRDGTGDQPLLNVHYPTIPPSHVEGRGATLATYEGVSKRTWMRLGVFELLDQPSPAEASMDLSNGSYTQSYCILKSQRPDTEVMFRFGSWLYSGDVELPNGVTLGSIPEAVVSMRVQQSKLAFVGDASSVSKSNRFANCLEHARDVLDFAESLVMESQDAISDLATNAKWIVTGDCFFKFTCCSGGDNNMDSVAVFAQVSVFDYACLSCTLLCTDTPQSKLFRRRTCPAVS